MSWFGAPPRPWQRRQDGSGRATHSQSEDDNTRRCILGEISGRNEMYDEFPPSQRKYPYGLGRPAAQPRAASPLVLPAQPQQELQQDTRTWGGPATSSSLRHESSTSPNSRGQTRKRPHGTIGDELRRKKRKLLNMDDWTGANLRRPLDIHFAPPDGDAPVWGWGKEKERNTTRSPTVDFPQSQEASRASHSRVPASTVCSWTDSQKEPESSLSRKTVSGQVGLSMTRSSSHRQESSTSQAWAGNELLRHGHSSSAITSRSPIAHGLQQMTASPRQTTARKHEWSHSSSERETQLLETDCIAVVSHSTAFSIPATPVGQVTRWDAAASKKHVNNAYQERVGSWSGRSLRLYPSTSPQTHLPDAAVPETPQSLAVYDDENELADRDDNVSADSGSDIKREKAVLEPRVSDGETFPVKRLNIRSIPDYTDDPIEEGSSDQEIARYREDMKKAAAMFRTRRQH